MDNLARVPDYQHGTWNLVISNCLLDSGIGSSEGIQRTLLGERG
jgi:hypothetical protein